MRGVIFRIDCWKFAVDKPTKRIHSFCFSCVPCTHSVQVVTIYTYCIVLFFSISLIRIPLVIFLYLFGYMVRLLHQQWPQSFPQPTCILVIFCSYSSFSILRTLHSIFARLIYYTQCHICINFILYFSSFFFLSSSLFFIFFPLLCLFVSFYCTFVTNNVFQGHFTNHNELEQIDEKMNAKEKKQKNEETKKLNRQMYPKLNWVDSLNIMHLGFNKDEAEKKHQFARRREEPKIFVNFMQNGSHR